MTFVVGTKKYYSQLCKSASECGYLDECTQQYDTITKRYTIGNEFFYRMLFEILSCLPYQCLSSMLIFTRYDDSSNLCVVSVNCLCVPIMCSF